MYTRLVARNVLWWLSGCALVGLGLAPLAAHHVISAKFDSAKTLTLRGPITAIDWANPHAHLFINAADRNGRIANWAIDFTDNLANTVQLFANETSRATGALEGKNALMEKLVEQALQHHPSHVSS